MEYGPDDEVRRVQDGGWISFHGQQFRLCKALAGEPVALRPKVAMDGTFDVYFCHQKIDAIEFDQTR